MSANLPLAVFGEPLATTDPFSVPQGGLHIFAFVFFTWADHLILEPWGAMMGVPNACLYYAEEPAAVVARVANERSLQIAESILLDVISSEERQLRHWNVVFVYWAPLAAPPEGQSQQLFPLHNLPSNISSFLRDDVKFQRQIERCREQ